jgi:RNA 3'-terminal phosphate cyclase (ATP)
MRVSVQPAARLAPLELLERGAVRSRNATAFVAALSPEIAKRELAVLRSRLGWADDELRIHEFPAAFGPGNVVSAAIESENVTEVFTGFGEKSVRAEAVAESVATEVRDYLEAGVPVGPHLADQLILPLALAKGGAFRTLALSPHARTQLDLVREMTGTRFETSEASGTVTVAVV